MSRRWRFPWDPRRQALSLLLAWCASLLLPAFHLEWEPERDVAAASAHGHCSGLFVAARGAADEVGADCKEGGGCENPWHHHHGESHHDATQCPICSSLVERIAETPLPFDLVPARVELAAPRAVRLPPLSERLVIALARGPPAGARAS